MAMDIFISLHRNILDWPGVDFLYILETIQPNEKRDTCIEHLQHATTLDKWVENLVENLELFNEIFK